MNNKLTKFMRICAVAASAAVVSLAAAPVAAHQTTGDPFPHTHNGTKRVVTGERYIPTIWVDPDGCEHWVMDDGWEGFMTPKLNRQGIPTCRGANVCGIMGSDALFATDSFHLGHAARRNLMAFFQSNRANAYIIRGHTDSRASDAYNMRLSRNRANAVAQFARSMGVNIAETRGFGERQPRASNSTRAGMAQNRRVEIICVN